MASDPFARLTVAQREAVFAAEERLAVFAGAGAGKTRVLTLRALRQIDDGVDPAHLLVVTFSRKAAQELRRRLWSLGVEGVRAGTFHATALELLEISRAERGLAPPKLITDRRRALERVAGTVPGAKAVVASGALDTELTWAKANDLAPDAYAERARASRRQVRGGIDLVATIFDRYETAKRRQGLLDFDDLITAAAESLSDPAFADAIHWRSRHVLIDEFQDVSPAQFELVEALIAPTTTLFVVGDPNQSIYGFNGADPSLLRTIDERMPSTRVIALDANFRSTPEIVSAADAVLPERDRREASATQQSGPIPEIMALPDDAAEAAYVAHRASSLRGPGGRWRSIAVLARTNAQLERFAQALEGAGIPCERLAPDFGRVSDPRQAEGNARRSAPERPVDAVVLATFHRAKGLEWPTVFVVGASEGFVPHAAATSTEALDEERRLLYVAFTRAERRLIATWAERRDADEPSNAPRRRRSALLDGFEQRIFELEAAGRPSPSSRSASRVGAIRAQLEERLARHPERGEP
jgi:DNA helicase-2/ATP-dependent DNA helicase PcrA